MTYHFSKASDHDVDERLNQLLGRKSVEEGVEMITNKRVCRKLAPFYFSTLHLVSGTQTLNKEKPLSEEKKSATLRAANNTMGDFT